MRHRREPLVQALLDAAREVIGDDVSRLRGFVRAQLDALAQQAVFIAAGIVDGSIDPPMQRHFLDALAEMTRSFVNTLVGLGEIAAERLWNALVAALWDGISRLASISLPPHP